MKRGPDKNGSGQRSQRTTSDAKTLSEMDISKDQSSRWQALGAVPEEDFEAALSGEEKPSTNGIIAKPSKMPETSLWLWGRLRDFERDGASAPRLSQTKNYQQWQQHAGKPEYTRAE